MINLAILANENPDDHLLWVKACQEFPDQVNYKIINITLSNWLEEVSRENYDYLLARPPGLTSLYKQLYDERIYIISTVLKLPIYPSLNEILLYENKRFLSYWLKANNLSHAETRIFYNKQEALSFLKNITYPVVGKSNIGSSGSGVRILKNKSQAIDYLNHCFSSEGAPKRWGPNFNQGGLLKRGFNYIIKPGDIKKKLNIYKTVKSEIQRGFAIFQEYIPHKFEWRIVAIGDSYFAHKKLKVGDKASGTVLKMYDKPTNKVLDFAQTIMDRFGFFSEAIDLFENENGDMLINEMQCMFGQSDPHQMLIDNIPGRYRYINNQWKFEEGMFNGNECFDLRLNNIIQLINPGLS